MMPDIPNDLIIPVVLVTWMLVLIVMCFIHMVARTITEEVMGNSGTTGKPADLQEREPLDEFVEKSGGSELSGTVRMKIGH